MSELSAGILTADLTRLGAELELLRGRAAYAHVDVMDGSFCPQLTVGPAFIAAAASAGVPVDAHLLVDEPARFLPEVVAAGAAIVTVHAEASRHPHRVLSELTALSAEVRPVIRGYAVNPGTPLGVIEPVLDLIDLVLVLAVDPGWPGQAPARGHRGPHRGGPRAGGRSGPPGPGRRRRRHHAAQRRAGRQLGR